MKFDFTGRHIEVTPALRTHTETLFSKLEPLFGGDDVKVQTILSVEKERQTAEINVKWRDQNLNVKDTNKDMYQAIAKAVAKLEKQALKFKDKTVSRKQTAKKRAEVAVEQEPAVETDETPKGRVVSNNRYKVKPMTADEAVLELTGAKSPNFVVYRDAATERVSVLYKRADGDFGLIQP